MKRELIVRGWNKTVDLDGKRPKRLSRQWFVVEPLRSRVLKTHNPERKRR